MRVAAAGLAPATLVAAASAASDRPEAAAEVAARARRRAAVLIVLITSIGQIVEKWKQSINLDNLDLAMQSGNLQSGNAMTDRERVVSVMS